MPKGYKGREKTERLHMLISPEEIAAIEEWRSNRNIATRAEAVRRLVQIGRNFDAVSARLADEAYTVLEKLNEIGTALSAGTGNDDDAGRMGIAARIEEAYLAQHTLAVLAGAIDDVSKAWRWGDLDEARNFEKQGIAEAEKPTILHDSNEHQSGRAKGEDR